MSLLAVLRNHYILWSMPCLLSAGNDHSDTTTTEETDTRRSDPRRDQADGEGCRRGPRGRGWTARTVLVDSWTDTAPASGKLPTCMMHLWVKWPIIKAVNFSQTLRYSQNSRIWATSVQYFPHYHCEFDSFVLMTIHQQWKLTYVRYALSQYWQIDRSHMHWWTHQI